MSKKWRSIGTIKACTFGLAVAAANAEANLQYQDPASLKDAVTLAISDNLSSYPYHNLEISVRSIDKRLRLKMCDSDLEASVSNPSQRLGRVTTEVRCDGTPSWKIYVQATVTAQMKIPVLIRPLARGAVVTKQDLELMFIAVGQQQQPIAETLDAVVGMELRRPASSGQPVLLSQLTAPDLIKRGQRVNIHYDESELRITMAGKALQSGARGEWISVENTSSGRHIEGRVERDGSIVVPGI